MTEYRPLAPPDVTELLASGLPGHAVRLPGAAGFRFIPCCSKCLKPAHPLDTRWRISDAEKGPDAVLVYCPGCAKMTVMGLRFTEKGIHIKVGLVEKLNPHPYCQKGTTARLANTIWRAKASLKR